MKTFAEIVDAVNQLLPSEKKELHTLLKQYLVEERRLEIRQNAEASLEEYRSGKLKSFSNVDELIDSL